MKSLPSTAALLAAGLCMLVLPACQHPAPVDLPPEHPAITQGPVKRKDIVRVGDLLDIYVMEDRELNGQFQVRESGNIVMPRVGRIFVEGSTLQAAQELVRSKVQSDQIKKATVIVERVRTSEQAPLSEMPKILFYVSGAVARPGQHRVSLQSQGGLSAFEGLLIAGGPTTFADQSHAYILRKTADGRRVRLPVNLRGVSKGEARDVPLQEGDVIFLPGRRFGL